MEPAIHSKRVSIFTWVFTGSLTSLVILLSYSGLWVLFTEDSFFYYSSVGLLFFFALPGFIFGLLNWGYQRKSYPDGYFSWDVSPRNIFEVFVINIGSALSMFAGIFIGVWLVIGWMALVLS